MDIPRHNALGTTEVETELVPIARDNLVCAVCDARLRGTEWTSISHPKRKGVLVFSCYRCVPRAKALLSKLL